MVVNPQHIARVREQLKKWNERDGNDIEIEGMLKLADFGEVNLSLLHGTFDFPYRLCVIGAACYEVLQAERQPQAA